MLLVRCVGHSGAQPRGHLGLESVPEVRDRGKLSRFDSTFQKESKGLW